MHSCDPLQTKLITLPTLCRHAARARATGKTIVFTNGCFDILHAGHVIYLQKARACGDILIVGLNSDISVRRIKGPGRPINNQRDRACVLTALACVDYVTIFNDPTPQALISTIRPDVLVKGADWKVVDIVGGDLVASYGGTIKRIPLVKGRSTTGVIRAIHRRSCTCR